VEDAGLEVEGGLEGRGTVDRVGGRAGGCEGRLFASIGKIKVE